MRHAGLWVGITMAALLLHCDGDTAATGPVGSAATIASVGGGGMGGQGTGAESSTTVTTGAGAGGATSTVAAGGFGGEGGLGGAGGDGGRPGTMETFANPPEVIGSEATPVVLNVRPARVTLEGQDYCLRTYNGATPGPTIRIPASANPRRVRLNLNNQLQVDDNQPVGMNGNTVNLNRTNLHMHGFHVQPEMTSDGLFLADNVLVRLEPTDSEQYRFDIDEDGTHEAGTFWFHGHVHGTTAIHMSNGLAGAVIIEGPVDAIPSIAASRERVMVMQHIAYHQATPLGPNDPCDGANISVNSFAGAASFTSPLTTNGATAPVMVAAPGSVERWRMLNAGVTHEMRISLFPAVSDSCDDLSSVAVPLEQIAADGYTFPQKWMKSTLFLAPGNRADVMVEVPMVEGLYCLVADTPGPQAVTRRLLAGRLVVESDAGVATGAMPTDAELLAVARPTLPCNGPIDGTQQTIFSQHEDDNGVPCEGGPAGPVLKLNINCQAFDPNDARVLQVGNTEEWELSTEQGRHPYHIHVNHFTVCTGPIDGGGPLLFPHWRDTLFLRPEDGITRVRANYSMFTGSFVSHCHKLEHEDHGMMEIVRIQ